MNLNRSEKPSRNSDQDKMNKIRLLRRRLSMCVRPVPSAPADTVAWVGTP